ncbi:hypothetical protein PMAYCL1PPCAC_21791, partial [Pristionchus mayeri]
RVLSSCQFSVEFSRLNESVAILVHHNEPFNDISLGSYRGSAVEHEFPCLVLGDHSVPIPIDGVEALRTCCCRTTTTFQFFVGITTTPTIALVVAVAAEKVALGISA